MASSIKVCHITDIIPCLPILMTNKKFDISIFVIRRKKGQFCEGLAVKPI